MKAAMTEWKLVSQEPAKGDTCRALPGSSWPSLGPPGPPLILPALPGSPWPFLGPPNPSWVPLALTGSSSGSVVYNLSCPQQAHDGALGEEDLDI